MKKLVAALLLALVPAQFTPAVAADNITINAGTAGYAAQTILRSVDHGGAHSQVIKIEDGAVASRFLKVNSDGSVNIGNFPATQPVSGTVSVSSLTVADNSTFNAGSSAVRTIAGCRQDSPATMTNGNTGCPRIDANRVWFSHPVDSGGSSITDATNHAIRATLVTIPQIGGQVAAGSVKGFPNCDKSAFLDMTTNTTTELVALTAGETVHVCHWHAVAKGTTTVKLISGTGTNCGSNAVDLTPTYSLVAQSVLPFGNGIGEVLSTQPTGALDAQNGRALCATNGTTEDVSIFVKYAKF